MNERTDVDFKTALAAIEQRIAALDATDVAVSEASDLVLAETATAAIDSPLFDGSEKDGFALRAADLRDASPENPVGLEVIGEAIAGKPCALSIGPGQAIQINTGGPIPEGADAVVQIEDCRETSARRVVLDRALAPGTDIMRRGSLFRTGDPLAPSGKLISPDMIGRLVDGGVERVSVVHKPSVALIAIGDELILPGNPITPPERYASNLISSRAWLARLGIPCRLGVVKDDAAAMQAAIIDAQPRCDLTVTIGATGGSNRDFISNVLGGLGWEPVFERVRILPGKGTLFGFLNQKPIICLPGGPVSAEMALLQLVFPAIERLAGHTGNGLGLLTLPARVTREIRGHSKQFTGFVSVAVDEREDGTGLAVRPAGTVPAANAPSRRGIVMIPEGSDNLPVGTDTRIQLIEPGISQI
jgi:molybdopterin molybdotransferase